MHTCSHIVNFYVCVVSVCDVCMHMCVYIHACVYIYSVFIAEVFYFLSYVHFKVSYFFDRVSCPQTPHPPAFTVA